MDNKIDTGLFCTFFSLQFFNAKYNHQNIIHKHGKQDHFTDIDIAKTLKEHELKSKIKKLKKKSDISNHHFPLIIEKENGMFIFCLQYQKKENKILIQDPCKENPELITIDDLIIQMSGKIILVAKRATLLDEDFTFGFSWFIKAFSKYKKIIFEIMTISFFIQLLSLLSPIFFQVTIDKVLVHSSLTTLDVLVIGLIAVTFFEVILSFLRTFLLNHTTNKVDVTLGSHLFSHLMNLPLSYFTSRKVGQISTRVRELDTIRTFITSSALTLCIDLVFTIIFFIVMWNYSKILTFIVFGSIPIYVFFAFVITPILQKKLNEKFLKAAENQAFLVESISGAETIKSLSIEPIMKQKWDDQLADYVTASFKVNNLGNLYNQFTSFVNKIVLILILYYGAQFVINGDMTIGMLIAFNMLASRISGPILHIAQLWNDFQQANISIKRLSDILNTKQERGHTGNSLNTKLEGQIYFQNVNFSYQVDSQNVIKNLNLKINKGEIIGIVGRSGSGKSTITKLIQRLYSPTNGKVFIDGMDISTIDPSWIRKQIGVVLQDNFLFNRTIKENISISNPNATLDMIMNAAKLSGADEFISNLPNGYETIIEEHGSNLSGGQKQRIAIARALLNNPRILIFDEATSALDYESESIIQRNMKRICEGRTVIIIAHRLSAIKNVNKIIVMEKGQIIEYGTKEELIKDKNGFFTKMINNQEQGL